MRSSRAGLSLGLSSGAFVSVMEESYPNLPVYVKVREDASPRRERLSFLPLIGPRGGGHGSVRQFHRRGTQGHNAGARRGAAAEPQLRRYGASASRPRQI